MSVFKNQLFVAPDEESYLLIEALDEGRLAVVIEAFKTKAYPVIRPMAWVEAGHAKADEAHTGCLSTARTTATPASIKKADELWASIADIVGNRALYESGPRWHLLSMHAKRVGCSPNTLIRALRLYWQGGQTQDALLVRRASEGSRARKDLLSDEQRMERCRRGRPATKPGSKNYPCNAVDRENFRQVIEDFWLKDERATLVDTLQRLREDKYSYRDGNGNRFLRPAGEHPTMRQLTQYLKKNYSVEHQMRRRKGDKDFERNHRPVLGTVEDICHGVGHIYEMDATIVDCTLVSSLSRQDIVGRPTLYLIIDRKSRLVVGWYLGFENPCWSAALHAIMSLTEDKEAMCNRLGTPYDPADWPAHGILPQHFWVDRGESMTREAVKLGFATHTTVTNVPSCRPDWKPVVEGSFRLIHQAIIDTVPGVNPSANAIKRRAIDFSLEAAHTLEELEKILVMMFITYNRTIRKRHELTRDEIAARVEPSPIELFRHGLKSRTGLLARYTTDHLRLALLPDAQASITEEGIWVNGMCYQPEKGIDKRSWFVEGRRATGAVKVTFDRRRADYIFVCDSREPKGYFVGVLARHSTKYEGMSVAEALLTQKLEGEILASAEHSKAQNRSDFHQFSDPVASWAKKLTAEAKKGVSKTARRGNTKAMREHARNLERDEVAIQVTTEPNASPAVNSEPVVHTGNVSYLAPRVPRAEHLSSAKEARKSMFSGVMPL